MPSKTSYDEAYVWTWLPGAVEPVVCGRLARAGDQFVFNYGQSYLARSDAISLYEPELPLRAGALPLPGNLKMPGCIRDGSPDAWGRRVIINRTFGRASRDTDTTALDELTYLLESGSDRIGALDFQSSPTRYEPRQGGGASLDQMLDAARLVEEGVPLGAELGQALFHGTSIGGARPKAMITDGNTKYIAKFSSSNDVTNVIKAEFMAMRLAERVGLTVAPVRLARVGDKDVLLVARFDRHKTAGGWQRKSMVSALTLMELDEMMARYASYQDFSTLIRHRFDAPRQTLRELFGRIVFNVLCGNTDDHARNHAAFWDGTHLSLTPAYDICPQARSGNEATQAMLITGDDRFSRIATCLKAAPQFQLSADQALALIEHQIRTILEFWLPISEDAGLSTIEREFLWRRQFLNPFAFEGAPTTLTASLAD